MNTNVPLDALPQWVLVVGGLVALVQLGFEIYALVDMLKRPEEQLTLGGRKWLWAILIMGVSWIGAIVYLAAGRKPAQVDDIAPSSVSAVDRGAAAADVLYGPRERSGRS